MNFSPLNHPIGIYPVVDSYTWVRRLASLVTTLQIRIKNADKKLLNEQIKKATLIAEHHKLQFFINDYWELALKYKAYGVHLGQEDLETADTKAIALAGMRLGISTHTEKEIEKALQYKPSYIAFGPVYFTHSKPMKYESLGAEKLAHWCAVMRAKGIKTVAIGGITRDNIKDVAQAKPDGIAMISAILHSKNPEKITTALARLTDV